MKNLAKVICLIIGVMSFHGLSAQEQVVEFPRRGITRLEAFGIIEEQSGLTIAYNEELIDITAKVRLTGGKPLAETMTEILDGTGTRARFSGKIILIVKDPRGDVPDGDGLLYEDDDSYYRTAMTAGRNMLKESVVVGYGTMQRGDITSSIGTYSPDIRQEIKALSPDALLQGRVSGVNVTASSGTPGTRNRVSIRGIGSLTAGNEPLYVVDGVPLSNTTGDAGAWGGESLSSLSDINPADIESIQILKDAASAAIYGSRGTNGVILITTRQGREGMPKVEANVSSSLSYIPGLDRLDVVDADLYLEVQNEAIDNYNRQTGSSVAHLENPYPGKPQFSWVDMMFRTAVSWNTNLSVSGGSSRSRYYISANARQTEGVVAGSRNDRYGARANVVTDIRKWLSVGVNVNFSHSHSDRVPDGNMGTSILTHSLEHRPWDTPFRPDGSYMVKDTDLLHYNQLQSLNEQDVYNKSYRMYGSGFVKINPIPGLSLKSSIGGDFMYAEDHIYYTAEHPYGNSVGVLTDARKRYTSLVIDNILDYGRDFGSGLCLDLMLGHSFQKDVSSTASQTGQGFPSESFDVNSVAAEYIDVTSGLSSWALQSFMFRGTVNWRDRYLLTLAARMDGSSKFAPENRYGFFPSVSAGWNISEEEFWSIASMGAKLRASAGTTGNQGGIGSYAYQALANGGFNYLNENGLAMMTQGNRDLRWEKAFQYDFGVDLAFFNGAMTVSADIFQKDTKDLLYNKPTSATTGFTYYTCNIGSMRNRGLELTVSGNAGVQDFHWNGSFNISSVRNRLTSLIDDEDVLTADSYHALKVGEEVGSFYLIKMTGIYQSDDEVPETLYAQGVRAGDCIYEDVNGDGNIDAVNDSQFTGSANPKFTGGLSNTFTFKGFDLNIFLTFSYGSYLYQTWTGGLRLGNGNWPAQVSEAEARWTGPGTSNTVPRAIYGLTWNSTRFKTTRYLHDASYLRCRSVSFGYTLPRRLTAKAGIDRLRVYVSADNLFLISPYRYIDPEVNTSLDATRMGLDCMWTPQPRTFSFGVNLKF